MKLLVVFALIGAAACGRLAGPQYIPPGPAPPAPGGPYPHQPPVPIVRLENENSGLGDYRYAYESADGTSAHEEGGLRGPESSYAQGAFSYTSPEGFPISVQYTADENGFQPQGAHLPTPPPLSEEIHQALQLNAAAANDGDDGQYHENPHQYNQPQQYLPPPAARGYKY